MTGLGPYIAGTSEPGRAELPFDKQVVVVDDGRQLLAAIRRVVGDHQDRPRERRIFERRKRRRVRNRVAQIGIAECPLRLCQAELRTEGSDIHETVIEDAVLDGVKEGAATAANAGLAVAHDVPREAYAWSEIVQAGIHAPA